MLNLLQSYTQLKISCKGNFLIKIVFLDLVFENIGCKRNINLNHKWSYLKKKKKQSTQRQSRRKKKLKKKDKKCKRKHQRRRKMMIVRLTLTHPPTRAIKKSTMRS